MSKFKITSTMVPSPINPKKQLEKSFILCRNYLNSVFRATYNRNDILPWFQGLCKNITEIIDLIASYYAKTKEKHSPRTQSTILLYLTQLIASLSLLINIFVVEEEQQVVITEARKCVIKQMSCCLESLEISIKNNQFLNDTGGNFVKWMDTALEKITEISPDDSQLEGYNDTRKIFEEVLSHAMSIAQVSLQEESQIIRGSCQSVLSTLTCLEKELKKSLKNNAMINLFIDACSNKLCILERKVNTAVLKLCVRTFSIFTEPLQKIQDFCFADNDSQDEFDGLVADFDLHVDRIMQIGLFALSCSSDLSKGIKIRSCLASLEALEIELVPALSSVLAEKSKHNIHCAQILIQHWLNQATALQELIYLIIDPFAFCQVTHAQASEIVDNLTKKKTLEQCDLKQFVGVMKILKDFLQIAETEFSPSESRKVQAKRRDFNAVFDEVARASEVLLVHSNAENSKRVLKRCKILLSVLKTVWMCFSDDLSDKKVTCDSEDLVETTGNFFLDHIISRGKQILQDRSVLYKTPIKSVSKNLNSVETTKSARKDMPLSKMVHLRKLCFSNVGKSEKSINLEITDLLNEMTNLSTRSFH